MSLTTMKDLTTEARRMLLDRIARVLTTERQECSRREGFHLEGVYLRRGTLYWHDDSPVHGFCHEAGHAMLLTPQERQAWEEDEIPTDEDVVMVLEVELQRGIQGRGVGRALADMDTVGYVFLSDHKSQSWRSSSEVSAQTWWRCHVRDNVALPWEVQAS